jgi:hypothetical protein
MGERVIFLVLTVMLHGLQHLSFILALVTVKNCFVWMLLIVFISVVVLYYLSISIQYTLQR